MPKLFNVGAPIYQFAKAAATINVVPLADRAAVVKRIGITSPSAADTWTVTCAGRELMRMRVVGSGNQNVLRLDDQATNPHSDFFTFCRKYLGIDASIPIPQGQTLTIASVGGATANLMVEFDEHSPADISPSMLNHPDGKEFLLPLYTALAASVAAAGVINDDTQFGPAWLPNFLIGVAGNAAWSIKLLALFAEGMGVNTFSGAANHQSNTNTKRFTKTGVTLFSRTTTGIPNVGAASAAGSANTVFGSVMSPFVPWERSIPHQDQILDDPITIQNGDLFQAQTEIVGDVTGGASYANALTLYVARISRLQ